MKRKPDLYRKCRRKNLLRVVAVDYKTKTITIGGKTASAIHVKNGNRFGVSSLWKQSNSIESILFSNTATSRKIAKARKAKNRRHNQANRIRRFGETPVWHVNLQRYVSFESICQRCPNLAVHKPTEPVRCFETPLDITIEPDYPYGDQSAILFEVAK